MNLIKFCPKYCWSCAKLINVYMPISSFLTDIQSFYYIELGTKKTEKIE